MPESPEVQALVEELGAQLTGRTITDVDVIEFRVTKTRALPLSTLVGAQVTGAVRHGKLVDLGFGPTHLVVSLGRHGWARWADGAAAPSGTDDAEPPPPALAAITFDDGRTLEFTDAGNFVSLGAWVVDDPFEVPAVAKLGPDPAAPGFSRADFDAAMLGRRKQVKAVLQEQESLAGVGNAYSDEILHAAKVSPVVHAAALAADERDRLFDETVGTIASAIDARRGIPIDRLKADKVAAMRVHGRAGEPCPRCGDTIRDFTFGSTIAQYCPTCQTDGAVLPLKEA
ncbi:DNA-formamidopyrimidine glycosylase family protein [Agromyces aurantiacus]|uniref:DNA-formamidopyrimidine glycosylase family protein n=1 Tax=Agromyces aurantiacus TaxID=165814 RepID=A0ABV9R6L6_9MICO|nr:DNA-formamidopyrimidine glycosylase family protein [Agromyces aurantiacus]MBM7503785.1 formamidopyrimidine-DNA glycosylase [Agromyces aurantiacus]